HAVRAMEQVNAQSRVGKDRVAEDGVLLTAIALDYHTGRVVRDEVAAPGRRPADRVVVGELEDEHPDCTGIPEVQRAGGVRPDVVPLDDVELRTRVLEKDTALVPDDVACARGRAADVAAARFAV